MFLMSEVSLYLGDLLLGLGVHEYTRLWSYFPHLFTPCLVYTSIINTRRD